MIQVATKLNKSKVSNIEPIKITIQLAPEQIIQAYQELIKQNSRTKKDWIYQEPFVSELKKRIRIANQEEKKIN